MPRGRRSAAGAALRVPYACLGQPPLCLLSPVCCLLSSGNRWEGVAGWLAAAKIDLAADASLQISAHPFKPIFRLLSPFGPPPASQLTSKLSTTSKGGHTAATSEAFCIPCPPWTRKRNRKTGVGQPARSTRTSWKRTKQAIWGRQRASQVWVCECFVSHAGRQIRASK